MYIIINYFHVSFNSFVIYICIYRDNTQNIMSVFCKGCRGTNDNEEFGLKAERNQYKTYEMQI